MRYALIRKMDISNGEGVGISLFVQGCHFHCKGCFNQETWDFDGGKEWNKEIENKFFELARQPHIKRISFLGGEPLADENVGTIKDLIYKLKEEMPQKRIWVYTGYLWEDIMNVYSNQDKTSYVSNLERFAAVVKSDVIVDGRFQFANQDINHMKTVWAGSTNQRTIDVKKSLVNNNIIFFSR